MKASIITIALATVALTACGKPAATASTVKDASGDFCGQVTPNTRVCLSGDGSYLTLSNPAGSRSMPVQSYDSTLWSGGTDYVGTADLSFVAGFGYTTLKLTYLDGQARLGYTGTVDGVSAQWFNWPGTTNDSSFSLTQGYVVPCCKS